MTTATDATTARARAAVEAVADPELPPVTIGMLGMVHAVTVDGDRAVVDLLPTFAGCPATEMIARDVESALARVDGVARVDVRFRFDPPWTPDRVTDEGRDRLRSFGIAPPRATGHPAATGRRTLPVVTTTRRAAPDPRPCPYCGSDDTVRDTPFGPTPCRDLRFCDACVQPFEAFKDL